jgi:hypothetical protein
MPDEAKSVPSTPSTPRRGAPERKQDSGMNYGDMLGGNQQAFGRWFQAMFALGQEITRFTQARLQEDMAAWSALAACRSPDEAMACQQRFAAKAAEQYTDEMSKLSQLMMKMSVAAPSPPPQ